MKLAPAGMAAAVLATSIGGGWKSVNSVSLFVVAAVAAQLFVGVVVYLPRLLIFRIPVWKCFVCTRQALGIALATRSSAAALPEALEGMDRFGLRRELLGLVMPLG